VAEYAASLPRNYKLHGRKSKYILKRAVADLVPSFVTRRGKKGFGIPVAEWLKKKLRRSLAICYLRKESGEQAFSTPST